ncbi:hypothetical protein FACS1894208_01700 [Clostridia bacterium]|nr:hypothetical protein FACS1894208_01700 [Clostridia bacterium]
MNSPYFEDILTDAALGAAIVECSPRALMRCGCGLYTGSNRPQ